MEIKKILFVDDEIDFLNIMSQRIKYLGYEVIAVSSGKDAIDALRTQSPDVIILDYLMPDMDGVATLEKIRNLNKKIPVIMFTAHPDIKVIKGTEKFEVDVFIPKLSVDADTESLLDAALRIVKKKLSEAK